MSEEGMMAAADLALVEQLREQNKQLSLQIGELNTTIGYQDAMLAELRRLLTAAYHALQSYARGNSAPDLAEEVAQAIEKVIET